MLSAAIKAIIEWVVAFFANWHKEEQEKKAEESVNAEIRKELENATTPKEREDAAQKVADNW